MTNKKYELLKDDQIICPSGAEAYRIRALRDISHNVHAGDLGGYITSESVLSHQGECWIGKDVVVCHSNISGNVTLNGKGLVYSSTALGDIAFDGDYEVKYSDLSGTLTFKDSTFIKYATAFGYGSFVGNTHITRCHVGPIPNAYIRDCDISNTKDMFFVPRREDPLNDAFVFFKHKDGKIWYTTALVSRQYPITEFIDRCGHSVYNQKTLSLAIEYMK